MRVGLRKTIILVFVIL